MILITKTSVYVCMYVCIFIKLHITAQSGLVILVILCHSRMYVCMYDTHIEQSMHQPGKVANPARG